MNDFKKGDLVIIKKNWKEIAKQLEYRKDSQSYIELKFLIESKKKFLIVFCQADFPHTPWFVHFKGNENNLLMPNFYIYEGFLEYFDYVWEH